MSKHPVSIRSVLSKREIKLLKRAIDLCVEEFSDKDVKKEYSISDDEYKTISKKLKL